jgi:hypothetical protein
MANQTSMPKARNTVKWYHQLIALPLQGMAALNLGPLGGENNISTVIEAILAKKKGQTLDFELSKSDRFFVQQLTKADLPDEMIEYRELNHEAQEEILRRWGHQNLGVIWVGAGVFTLTHPMLARRKKSDWHFWTDASPKIVADARQAFQEIHQQMAVDLTQSVRLPQDFNQLNLAIQLVAPHVSHIVINGYGVTYALTPTENFEWLSGLELPPGLDLSFIFNSPGSALPPLPGIMAAFHRQRMMYYEYDDIETLFAAALPGSRIVWTKPRTETRNKLWETWIIHVSADERQ